MKSKVFISCGQRPGIEQDIAKKISDWFQYNGYHPYVAISAQSIQDVNSGIIKELKSSDYYVFIDFKREKINETDYRGSLFTNQELAIAYVLEFEKAIFLKQEDVLLEGLAQYMISNSATFKDEDEVYDKVIELVKKHNWTPQYSRHLHITDINKADGINYSDQLGSIEGSILTGKITNYRKDLPAFNTIARLEKINDEDVDSSQRNCLKAAGLNGYSQVIWPNSYGYFDLLLIAKDNQIYLNSASDVSPRKPIITKAGVYELTYSVLSIDFPVLRFTISIKVDSDIKKFEAKLKEVTHGL